VERLYYIHDTDVTLVYHSELASSRCIPNCHDNAFLDATLDEDHSDILVCAELSSCHLMQEGIVYFCSEKGPHSWQERNEIRYEEW
jgi:hypothetical protein